MIDSYSKVTFAILASLLPANPGLGSETDVGSRAGHAYHRFLHDTDCSIAADTRVVHYPTIHRDASQAESFTLVLEDADFEFDPVLVQSGFNFVQFIKRHRKAAVFSEAYWTSEMVDEYRDTRKHLRRLADGALRGLPDLVDQDFIYRYSVRRIKSVLLKADEIADLDSTTESLLDAMTGADVAFVVGIVDDLFPTTTLGSVDEVFARFFGYHDLVDPTATVAELDTELRRLAREYNLAEDPEERSGIKSRFSAVQLRKMKVEKVIHDSVFFWREYLLLRSVRELLEDPNQDRLVVLSYGAAHDFSDEFADYAFQALPMACSVSFDSAPAIHRFLFLVRMADYSRNLDELALLHSEIVAEWAGLSESDVQLYLAFREFQLDVELAKGAIDEQMRDAMLARIGEAPLEHLESELRTRQGPVEGRIDRAFDTYVGVYR